MDKEKGKKLLSEKVNDFEKNKEVYLSKNFDETETRTHFINPLFETLGWNFNQTSLPYSLWDVHQEYSQKNKKRKTKKPDYAFRLEKKLKFFVEAKAPNVDLTSKEPVFQAKSYAFSTNGKAPIVILTDFQEFRVFNALERPIFENPLQGLLKQFDFTYESYLDNWDLLYTYFSKEAVQGGSLLELKGKVTKNTKTLDKEFLNLLMGWRKNLAMRIAKDNTHLSESELNEVVQRILDRLIFLRNLEDREIEENVYLLDMAKSKNEMYPKLLPLFARLNTDYNGLLFHPHISEDVKIDDKTLKSIVKNLYPPESPFQFDVIEPEILGRIYENFLGSKIHLTETHLARVKEKPEVVHAKGVYYTPEWIVENIVQDTVVQLIKDKNPTEIKKIKILDPACGSGSFLLGAYQTLLDYHKEWYAQNKKIHKYEKDYYLNEQGDIILTSQKKGEILKNNIFGVDIDREATEVAILSLYIKVMEDGSDTQGLMFKQDTLLPKMTDNIKCGNSLIDREALYESDMFGKEDILVFDWQKEFADVFAQGGFDAIIGNPPYIKIQELQKWAKEEVELYKKIYQSGTSGNFDIYVLFIERAMQLLNSQGLFGMILPNKFFTADYGQRLRGLIKNSIFKVVDFGDNQIFEGPTTYTCLLFLNKAKNKKIYYVDVFDLGQAQNKIISLQGQKAERKYLRAGKIENTQLSEMPWYFTFGNDKIFFDTILQAPLRLSDVSEKIYQGIITGADKIFIVEEVSVENNFIICYSKALEENFKFEKALLKPLLKGSEIVRYSKPDWKYWLLFPYKVEGDKAIPFSKLELKQFPNTFEYLFKNKRQLEKRENGKWKISDFWQFSRNQNMVECSRAKILTQVLASKASFTADFNGDYYFVGGGNAGGYGVKLKTQYQENYHYVLGLLNSKILDKYLQHISSRFRGGFYSYAKRFIEKLPIYIPTAAEPEKLEFSVKIENAVKQILEFKKNGQDKDAAFLEEKIDAWVSKIYGV